MSSYSSATSTALSSTETLLGFCPGGTQDYTGDWPTARTQLETWLNTGGAPGHRIKMLHGIAGTSWQSGSYGNCRGLWANLPSDVQPLISIPSLFPQWETDSAGNYIYDGSGNKIPCTYDKALAGNYDALYTNVLTQIATDYPWSSLRIGQELEGGWFYDGLGSVSGTPATITGGTPAKAKQLIQHINQIRLNVGHKGTSETNCGIGTNPITGAQFTQDDVNPGPPWINIASVDTYAVANTTAQAADPAGAWLNVQLPMIQQCMNVAKKYGIPWAMSEWGVCEYVDGTAQTLCGDDTYYIDHLHALVVDGSNPHCAYLSYFNGNDHNGNGTLHRVDAVANPASLTSGPWSDASQFPNSIARLKGTDWTPAGLTQNPPPVLTVSQPRRRHSRRATNISTLY